MFGFGEAVAKLKSPVAVGTGKACFFSSSVVIHGTLLLTLKV